MDNLLKVHEVAEKLRRHPKTIRRWIKAGTIKAIEIPGRGKSRTEYLISAAEVERIIRGEAREQ